MNNIRKTKAQLEKRKEVEKSENRKMKLRMINIIKKGKEKTK